MAKRKRRRAKPQAQEKRRRRAKPQAQTDNAAPWRAQLEDVGRALSSPLLRDRLSRIRQVQDSPQMREHAKTIRRLHGKFVPPEDPPVKPATAKAKRRKPGAGAKRKLTAEEIARLQTAYEAAYRGKAKRKQSDVFNELRELLGRHVGDSTLRFHVVRPLGPNFGAPK
jgi:hypothetical protein